MANGVGISGLFRREEFRVPPFIPLVFTLSARIAQVTLAEMVSDAGTLSRALLDTQQLLETDAIINPIDPVLEAEAFGCTVDWDDSGEPTITGHLLAGVTSISPDHEQAIDGIAQRGRIPLILDATRRLAKLRPPGVALIVGITGPLSLANQLTGISANIVGREVAGRLLKKLMPAFCETGINALAVFEPEFGKQSCETLTWLRPVLQSMKNIARYYRVPLLIVARVASPDHVRFAYELGADGVVGGPLAESRALAEQQKRAFGAVIPLSIIEEGDLSNINRCVTEIVEAAGHRGVFLTTEWDLPRFVSLEGLRAVRDALYQLL